jgi:hypothetical protein
MNTIPNRTTITTDGKPSELMKLALLCSPTVICSLELKVLARMAFELAETPDNPYGPTFSFLATNLARISINLNRLEEASEATGGCN